MRTNEPPNEGRIFKAWCGGEYIFVFSAITGRLRLRPYDTGWAWWDKFIQQSYRDRVAAKEYYFNRIYDDREARRVLKDISFYRRYGVGRMTVDEPPFYPLYPED